MVIEEHRITIRVRLSNGVDRIVSGFIVRTQLDTFVRFEERALVGLGEGDRDLAREAIYDAWIESNEP